MTVAVAINNLMVCYPSGYVAVNNLSLDITTGEIFGLLGLNGAGKSSLIKTMITLLRPSSGWVSIFGLDSFRYAPEVKRRIGVVPQESNLDIYLNVRLNLLFHCRYAGIPTHVAEHRVESWLSLLAIDDKADESVLHLSGGTRRKVMLAKAFITEPDLLVLDEPSAGLDPDVRNVLWEQIRAFRDRGGTVLLSTHYLEEAETLCDRIGILHQGRLVSLLDPGGATGFTSGEAATAFSRETGIGGGALR